MSHEALMERVLESIQGLDSKLNDIGKRLKASEDNMDVCMRGLQVLLLERATKLQIVRSLHEVTEVLLRLEAAALAERDSEPPPTLPHNTIPTPD